MNDIEVQRIKAGGKTYRAIDPNSSEIIAMPYEVPLFPEMCILKDEPFKVHGGM